MRQYAAQITNLLSACSLGSGSKAPVGLEPVSEEWDHVRENVLWWETLVLRTMASHIPIIACSRFNTSLCTGDSRYKRSNILFKVVNRRGVHCRES